VEGGVRIFVLNAKTERSKVMEHKRAELDRISNQVIGAAIEVHKELGPGLLESVYEYCLKSELERRELKVASQVQLPIYYKGEQLDKDFYIDLLVENELVVELKCVEIVLPVHEVQLVTYLKLSDKRLGLLLNFNVSKMKDGIIRRVNQF
jgi:GxxExxY protein